jgi:hypothetical protein
MNPPVFSANPGTVTELDLLGKFKDFNGVQRIAQRDGRQPLPAGVMQQYGSFLAVCCTKLLNWNQTWWTTLASNAISKAVLRNVRRYKHQPFRRDAPLPRIMALALLYAASSRIGGRHAVAAFNHVQENAGPDHQAARDALQAVRCAYLFFELLESSSRSARSKEPLNPQLNDARANSLQQAFFSQFVP